MSNINPEDVTEEQLRQQELDDEAAFEAGFGSDDTTETHSVTVTEEKVNEPEPEIPEPMEESPVLAGLTESQIKELFSRMGEIDNLKQSITHLHDKTFGTLGEYKTKLTELQSNQGGKPGRYVNLKAEQLKRLYEFEPDLAEILAEDLSESLASGEALDTDSVSNMIQENIKNTIDNVSRKYELKLLHFAHPDVDELTRTPDWGTWLASQDEAKRQLIGSSTDALELSREIARFKEWRDKTATDKAIKNKRLESAILPTDNAVASNDNSLSDEEAFLAGWERA